MNTVIRRLSDVNGVVRPEPCTGLLWDVHATAKALNIGQRTLARLTRAGDIPCVRIGRRVLFDPRDLPVWIERRKQARLCATASAEEHEETKG